MPGVVTCPRCEKPVEPPDDPAGGRVRCPACGTRFRTRSARAAPPVGPPPEVCVTPAPRPVEPVGAARPALRRPRLLIDVSRPRPDSGWQAVRIGITLVLAALVSQVVLGLTAFCLRAGPGKHDPELARAVVTGGVLVGLGLEALRLVAYGCCLAAPRARGARALAAVNLLLAVLVLVPGAVVYGLELLAAEGVVAANPPAGGAPAAVLGLLAGLLRLVQLVVFLFFLRAVARVLYAFALERSVQGLLVLLAAVVGLTLLALLAFLFAAGDRFPPGPPPGPDPGMKLGALVLLGGGCALLVAVVGALIWYIVVLAWARRVLGEEVS